MNLAFTCLALIVTIVSASGWLNPLPANASDPEFPIPHQHGGRGEHSGHHSNESSDRSDHHGHHHGNLEVPADQPRPTVEVVVSPDAVSGWNLEARTTNFRFAPENVNGTSNTQEGHAHLYINGNKMTRLYSNWFYLEDLPPGEHTITVSLNANGHEALTLAGEPIEATIVLTVPSGEK